MLAEQLERCEQTLIRGDLRLGNLGFSEDRVVLIDWGERVGSAPPSVELAWFIGFDSYRMEVAPDDVIVEFRRLYRDRFDETALQLSLIGGLVQLGGVISLWIVNESDEAQRHLYRSELSWWDRTVAKPSSAGLPAEYRNDLVIRRRAGSRARRHGAPARGRAGRASRSTDRSGGRTRAGDPTRSR